jgi:predicted tellurium resistance membrane protein TerC
MSAYLMIGWIGIKLCVSAAEHESLIPVSFEKVFDPIFWTMLALLLAFGLTRRKARG